MTAIFLFVLGVALILWSAEWLTDGVLATAASFAISAFFVDALVLGFEPENLVTGVVANFQGLAAGSPGYRRRGRPFLCLGRDLAPPY